MIAQKLGVAALSWIASARPAGDVVPAGAARAAGPAGNGVSAAGEPTSAATGPADSAATRGWNGGRTVGPTDPAGTVDPIGTARPTGTADGPAEPGVTTALAGCVGIAVAARNAAVGVVAPVAGAPW
ncbi:hypothetical protein AWC22_11395 [Mycobacterium riyadhense]|uniref:Uncharacterized protein n=1 Tax=Mycobacterium riyadhense TaxID=486698 RepID=A0A1X2DBW8_9MYCO|nr:hypothetical protein AWC22_11395 [Mycobacterium riyadhense]